MNLFLRRMLVVGIIVIPAALVILVLVIFRAHAGPLWLAANIIAAGDQVFGAWSIFPPLVSWILTGFVAGFLIYFAFYESFRAGGTRGRNVCIMAVVFFLAAGAVVWPRLELALGGRMLLRPGTDRQPGFERTFADIDFVWAPPGRFPMGSPPDELGRKDDETLHLVTLSRGFWMSSHEVTQQQWTDLMGNNPSEFKGNDLPVQNVEWDDCKRFIEQLNAVTKRHFRLPTEAEWEYACRAGTLTTFACGDDAGPLGEYAWYAGNNAGKPEPGGQKKPNAWGLYDMSGNMWEWCEDWYGEYPVSRVVDPTGPATGKYHVLRGGGWTSSAEDCRCARRYVLVEGYFRPKNDIGFRLVLDGE